MLSADASTTLERPLWAAFVLEWGAQVAWGVLPGVLVIAAFLACPVQFLNLGPTAMTVATLALVLIAALPLHSYGRFLRLKRAEPLGRDRVVGESGILSRAEARVGARAFWRAARTPRVEALERELCRRAGRRPAPWTDTTGGIDSSPRLALDRFSAETRASIERAYADLDLEPGAGLESVRRSYRRLMRSYHPDRHGGDQTTALLADELARHLACAYSTLVDAYRRFGPASRSS